MVRSALICGASIAGPALAHWLTQHGWKTVVVERAPELRLGGQNVDVRGAGREVARRMQLEDAIRAATTGERGVRFVDTHNVTIAEFPAGTSDTDGPTAELEVLRGELARILVERTRADTEYVFGDHVTGLHDEGTSVEVSFARSEQRTFDIVIGADGFHSTTRRLLFGPSATIERLGLCTSYFTIPRGPSDTAWARWYSAPGGRTMTVRPDNVGTTRAALSFLSDDTFDGLEQPKQLLTEKFRDAGWEAKRLLAGLAESDDLFFESVGQVHMPRWSRGRVALVGDAAYCASPISGMGTSLALVGAYVLAGELKRNADPSKAFEAYERILRPYVKQAQSLPPGAPRLANPKTRIGIAAFNTALKIAASPALKWFSGKLFSPPADAIDLPRY